MSSMIRSLFHNPMRQPPDLTLWQQTGLAAFVAVFHVAIALWVVQGEQAPLLSEHDRAITVSMIQDAGPAQIVPTLPVEEPSVQNVPAPAPPVAVDPPLLSAAHNVHHQPAQVIPSAPAPESVLPNEMPPVSLPQASTDLPVSQGAVAVSSDLQAAQAPPMHKVLPASAVRYVYEPQLSYPRVSRELGEQGVVMLKVLVDELGRPGDIELFRSSGYNRLDHQAVLAMTRARFQPHLENGQPRKVWVIAPLTFKLED